MDVFVARYGYTGEDGFEIFVWEQIVFFESPDLYWRSPESGSSEYESKQMKTMI